MKILQELQKLPFTSYCRIGLYVDLVLSVLHIGALHSLK